MSDSPATPKTYRRFKIRYPRAAEAYEALGAAAAESGPLEQREVRLVKLGLAAASGSEGAVHSAVRKGLEAGLNHEEMRQIPVLAIGAIGFSRAMAASTWIDDILGDEE